MDPDREPGIRFIGVTVDRVEFRDVAPGELPQRALEFSFALQRKEVTAPTAADVTVMVRVTSKDSASRLYLDASVTGRFQPLEEDPNFPLSEFAETNGPAIVFPFVREFVANLTARTRQGMVLFPPVNVAALVKAQKSRESVEVQPE